MENFFPKKLGQRSLHLESLHYYTNLLASMCFPLLARLLLGNISYTVAEVPNLIFLNCDAITTLRISLNELLYFNASKEVKALSSLPQEPDQQFQNACLKLCDDYAELFKPE